MKKRETSQSADSRDWRVIRQSPAGKAVTDAARRRRRHFVLKLVGVSSLFVGLLGVGTYAFLFVFGESEIWSMKAPGEPLRSINFSSNGVLDNVWFQETVELPLQVPLMGIDLFALKGQLEKFGQVKEARISRAFPDALNVEIDEREPLFRIRIRAQGGALSDLLVARDGTLFEGDRFSRKARAGMPYLGGVRVVQTEEGFLPLPEFDQIVSLLLEARQRIPGVARGWQVFHLQNGSPAPAIYPNTLRVRGGYVFETVFTLDSLTVQFDRLIEIIHYLEKLGVPSVKKIDLSLTGGVAVQTGASLPSLRLLN